MKIFELEIPGIILNRPKDSDNWLRQLIWLRELIWLEIKKGSRLDQKLVWLQGRIKQIITGEKYRLDPKNERPYDLPIDPKNNDLSKDEEWFLDVLFHENIQYSRTRAKNPEQAFEKLWNNSKPIIDKLIRQAGSEYFWTKFVQKIEGRHPQRLTLEEQGQLIGKGDKPDWKSGPAPEWVQIRLLGRSLKGLDFSGQIKLNTMSDFFEYARLPAGGKLAEAIPESLLSTFFPRLKESMMVNHFGYDNFMNFMLRFCDLKTFHRYFKSGKVYRIGGIESKRQWYGASKSLEGILHFIGNWKSELDKSFPIIVHFGPAKYFDVRQYVNMIRQFLKLDPKEDPEDEVFIDIKNLTKLSRTMIISNEQEYHKLKYPNSH